MPMNCFIRRENLRLLREKLTRATSDAECKRIVALIEEEEAKAPILDGRDHCC